MRKRMMVAMVAAVSVASPVFALDLNDVLGTVDLGGTDAGLPLVGGSGIALDGLAEVGLLGSTIISSENADPLISANVLDTPTDTGQTIADVKVGGSDLLALDDLLGTLDLGDVLGGDGSGDLVGGLIGSVGGLIGGGSENGGGSNDLVGGVVDTVGGLTGGGNGGGSSDLVGGVTEAVGGLTGGGGNGGGSNDLVGGVTGAVGGLVGGLTGGLLN